VPDFNIDLSISHGLLQPAGLCVLGFDLWTSCLVQANKNNHIRSRWTPGGHCFLPVLLFSNAVYELPFIVGSRSQHRNIPIAASRHLQHRDVTYEVASSDYPMSSANGD